MLALLAGDDASGVIKNDEPRAGGALVNRAQIACQKTAFPDP
jgi:hypothetical protein